MDAGVLRRLHDIASRHRRVKERDVFRHRAGDQENVLIYRRHGIQDHGAGQLFPRYAVKGHRAAPFLVKPGDDFRERRFAASGSAHHGHPAAGTHVHIEIREQRFFQWTITEGNVCKGQLPGQPFPWECPRCVVRRKIQLVHLIAPYVVQSLHLHFRRLQRSAQPQQSVYRRLETAHQILERQEHARRHRPVHDGEAAESHDQRAVDAAEERRQERHRHLPHGRFLRGGKHLCLIARPFREEIRLVAVRFDGLDHAKPVHRDAVSFARILLYPHVEIGQMTAHGKEQDDAHRAERHADQCQRHVVLQEQKEIEHRHDQIQYRRRRRTGEHARDGLVEPHAARHLRRIPLVEELHRQPQEVPKIAGRIGQRQLPLPRGQHHGPKPGDRARDEE